MSGLDIDSIAIAPLHTDGHRGMVWGGWGCPLKIASRQLLLGEDLSHTYLTLIV